MARTAQQQLDALDLAITEIEEGAQEVSPGNGKSYTLGDLSTMYKERRRLELVARRRSGRISIRGARLA